MISRSRVFGLALALAGGCAALLGPLAGEARGYSTGHHRGYVGTRGVVLEDGAPVWALYAPDETLPSGAFVPGAAMRLQPAKGVYKDAIVLSRDEVEFAVQQYQALRAQYAGKFELIPRDQFPPPQYKDRDGNPIPLPALNPRTTHVMKLRNEETAPGVNPLLAQFPLYPDGVQPTHLTYLIQTQPGSGLGSVLYPSSSADKDGIVTYLSAFFSEAADEAPVAWGVCDDFNGAELNNLNVEGRKGRDDLSTFDRCDAWRVGRVWGPIVGAWVDSGSRWMVPGNHGVQTNAGLTPDAVDSGQLPNFNYAGRYDLDYPYIEMSQFWDTMYVTLNFQPFDIRSQLGARWFHRKRVQGGATLEVNVGALSAYATNFVGLGYGNILGGQMPMTMAQWGGGLIDTHKWRSVNFGIEVAHTNGFIKYINEPRPGIPLFGEVIVSVNENDPLPKSEPPHYGHVPAFPKRKQVAIDLSTGEEALPGATGPIINRVQVAKADLPAGLPLAPDGTIDPIYDADLVQDMGRSDFANTDIHVFGPAGDLVTTRIGLRPNESPGLTCEPVATADNPFANPICRVTEGNPAAETPIADFIRNRYPGARYRVVVVNRSTGYVGTGFVKVGSEKTTNGLNSSLIEGNDGALIKMRPPNLKVEVKRVPMASRPSGNDLCADLAPSEQCEQLVGFEGGGLTDDERIVITTTWLDWDGSPLPANLPGFTGRLSRVIDEAKLGPADALDDQESIVEQRENGQSKLGQFTISPGRKIQVLRLADPRAYHYYLHVSGANNERCGKANADSEPLHESWEWFTKDSPACASFAKGIDDTFDGDAALGHRPGRYVPVLVPVFDANATAAAVELQVRTAKEQAAANGTTLTALQRVHVPPIYRDVYRAEQQFTVYDLPEFEAPEVITTYDPEKGRTSTSLNFGYSLGSGGFDPLEPYGSDKDPIWGLGFDELLAMVDEHNAAGSFNDLETIYAMSPAGQLDAITGLAGQLTPEDYLALQLYLGNDRGNALYQDLDIPYLMQIDAQPITLARNEILSPFRGDVPLPPYLDEYRPIAFRLVRPAYVTVDAIMPGGGRLPLVAAQSTGAPVPAGLHYFILDGGTLNSPEFAPNFTLQFEARLADDATAGVPSQFNSHIAQIAVTRSVVRNGRPLGEIIEHDVNILDGSLNLSRRDFSFPGLGPELSFVRSYSSLGSDEGDLGPGWSHGFNMQLVTMGIGPIGPGSVPDWVENLRGKIANPDQVEPFLFPAQPAAPSFVRVNGAMFVNANGAWVGEKGRQATLEQCDLNAPGFTGSDCFTFVSRDGTRYSYDYPHTPVVPPAGPGMSQPPIVVDDGLAERLGMPQGFGVPPGIAGLGSRSPSHVNKIADRFGNTMRFVYDDGRLTDVTDATNRECTFRYTLDALPDCEDTQDAKLERLRVVSCLAGEAGVNGENAALKLSFCYDSDGNLGEVRRGRKVERYTYARQGGLAGQPFNLTSFRDANDSTQTIHYYETPGEISSGIGVGTLRREEMVRQIEFPSTQGKDGLLNPVVDFAYDDNTRTITDPRGHGLNKKYTLNDRGNPTRIDEPGGKYTELVWSPDGSSTCGDGAPSDGNALLRRRVNRGDKVIETSFGYDELGNVTEECGPGGYTQTWGAFGLIQSRTDFRGIRESWVYDAKGFLLEHHQDLDHGDYTSYFTPDPSKPGRVKQERVKAGGGPGFPNVPSAQDRVTEYEYDAHGNLSASQIPGVLNSRRALVHDARGRVGRSIDRRGAVTNLIYSQNDHIEHVRLPADIDHPQNAHVVTELDFTHDDMGNRLTETDRNGLSYTYFYTQQNQVKRVVRAADREGQAERTVTYDEIGNITTESDWAGKKVEHTYDDLGFRETTSDRMGANMTTLRDLLGNVTSATDYAGLTTIMTYDDLNREVSAMPQCSDPDCVVRQTSYEVAPQLSGAVYVNKVTDGNLTFYTGFDGRGLQVRQKDPIGGIYEWDYDRLGQLVRTVDEAGFATTFEYDQRGYLTATFVRGLGSEPPIVQRIEPDGNGNTHVLKRWREGENEQALIETITEFDAWNRPRSRHFNGANLSSLGESFKYDGAGNVVEHIDTGSRPRKWERDKRGQLRKYTDAENGERTYEDFDANGNPRLITDARGVQTTLAYDYEERLSSIWEGSNRPGEDRKLAVTSRDGLGNPKTIKDFRGHDHQLDYFARHRLRSETHPGKPSLNYTYTPSGQVKTVTNARGFVRTFGYDGLDRVRDVFYPDLNTRETQTLYDAVGNVTSVENLRGSIVEYEPDAFLRVHNVKRHRGAGAAITVATYEYDDLGNVVSATDAGGSTTEFEYNNRNQLERTVYAAIGGESKEQRSEVRDYYDSGTVRSVTLPHDALDVPYTTTYEYDNEDRLISQLAAGERTTLGYDKNGNVTKLTKPEGQPGGKFEGKFRQFDYDALNRLEYVTDEVKLKTKYAYDPASNVRHVYGPYLGDAWAAAPHVEYRYDPLVDRVIEHLQYRAVGGALSTSFDEYDAHDNVKSLRDPKGRTFSYDYDRYDRLTHAGYVDDPTTPFMRPQSVDIDFNDAANIVTTTERKKVSGNPDVVDTTVEERDPLFDRLVSSTQRGVAVTYDYFNNGNRRSVTSPAGTTSYQYDARNRLRQATVNGAITTYDYHQDGRIKTVDTGNGTATNYAYWPTLRVKEINHAFDDRNRSFNYSYDKNGNPLGAADITTTGGGAATSDVTTFDQYDAADRLLVFTQDGKTTTYTFERYNRATEKVNSTPAVDKTYDYDPVSERLQKITDTVADKVVNYETDDNGNVTARETTPTGDRDEFSYNVLDQLTQVTRGPPGPGRTLAGQFDYDAGGRRVRQEATDRGSVKSTYDGIAVLEESVNSLPTRFHYANGLLASSKSGSDDQYFHQDRLGSVANTSGGDATAGADYKFDPFGGVRTQPAPGSTDSRVSFTGQQRDESTGLYYYGARFYDASLGRFLTQDTWSGSAAQPESLQKYLYAYSNPAKYTDPTGHAPEGFPSNFGPADRPNGQPAEGTWARRGARPDGSPHMVADEYSGEDWRHTDADDDDPGNPIKYAYRSPDGTVTTRSCSPGGEMGPKCVDTTYSSPEQQKSAAKASSSPKSAAQAPHGHTFTNEDLNRWYGPSVARESIEDPSGFRPTLQDPVVTAPEPPVASTGDKAWGFAKGFGTGFAMGVATAAFIGFTGPIGWVAVIGYGAYSLAANDWAGAKAIGTAAQDFAEGKSTAQDWEILGGIVGGFASGGVAKPAAGLGTAVRQGLVARVRPIFRAPPPPLMMAPPIAARPPPWSIEGLWGNKVIVSAETEARLGNPAAVGEGALAGEGTAAADGATAAGAEEGISAELYEALRKQTPSPNMRRMVNQGRQGPYRDPALPGVVADVLEADHVLAMKTIVRLPGFGRLTRANMLKVLNFRRNFIGLSKAANTSKGARDWFEWTMHKSKGIPVRPEFAAKMQRKQLRMEFELQNLIEELLAGQ